MSSDSEQLRAYHKCCWSLRHCRTLAFLGCFQWVSTKREKELERVGSLFYLENGCASPRNLPEMTYKTKHNQNIKHCKSGFHPPFTTPLSSTSSLWQATARLPLHLSPTMTTTVHISAGATRCMGKINPCPYTGALCSGSRAPRVS